MEMKNQFKDIANELKPREQMLAAARVSDVSSESLLAILLKTGSNGCDVIELSRRLLSVFGSLEELIRCDWREIQNRIKDYNKSHPSRRVSGIGPVKILELGAAFELGRRAFLSGQTDIRQLEVQDAESCVGLFAPLVRIDDDQENLWMLPLDAKNHPISRPLLIARGVADQLQVNVRDIFTEAVRKGASSIVIAHNHPSGEKSPSVEDITFTKMVIEAAGMLGLRMLDHLIVICNRNGHDVSSVREMYPAIF